MIRSVESDKKWKERTGKRMKREGAILDPPFLYAISDRDWQTILNTSCIEIVDNHIT